MASDQEVNTREDLKRDEPLFTARQYRSSHQTPDFFTESLNNSKIPSPSPTREDARDKGRAKPRRVLGTPRGLAASFKATANSHDDPFPFSPAPHSEVKRTAPTETFRPSQAGRANPLRKTADGRSSRQKTPSPRRGRHLSIASPSSTASSPPREFAETYQRINDEENLAQQDYMEDDMGSYDASDYTRSDRLTEDDQTRSEQIAELDSPTPSDPSHNVFSRTREEIFSPDPGDIETNQQAPGEESGDLDLENPVEKSPTRQRSQVAKTTQQVHGLINNTKAFSKARLFGRVGLTYENLSRRNGSIESLGSPLVGGSVSSKGSDLPSNIPREWGRKARPDNDWLSRINSKSGRYTGDVSKRREGNTTIPENGDVEPLDEWVNTSQEASNFHPDDPSVSSPESTATTSMQNRSLERVTNWDINNDEFTGRSLQVSDSPPIRVRPHGLDRDVDREIDSVAKKAVTTNRLDELREKTPDERLKKRLHTRSEENLSHQRAEKAHQTPQHRRSSLKFQIGDDTGRRNEQLGSSITSLGDEGDPIPDSPVVVYRGTPGIPNKDVKEGGRAGNSRDSFRRASQGQHDPRDFLRQLARATSESPSARGEELLGHSNDVNRTIPAQSDENPQRADQQPTTMTRTTENEEKDVDQSRDTKRPEADRVKHETPQPPRSRMDLKTPLVTGAWIDTPLPTGGRGPPLPTPANLDEDKDIGTNLGAESPKLAAKDLIRSLNTHINSQRPKQESSGPPEYTGPPVPKSALQSIISDAKAHSKSTNKRKSKFLSADSDEDPTLLLGESTIQSLEEIVKDDTKAPKLSPLSQESSAVQSDDDHSLDDLANTQKTSFSTVESQMSRLDNVGPSIRDAKRRLAFLERAVSQSKRRSSYQDQCDEGGEIHDFVWPCEKCGYMVRRDTAYESSGTDGLATISITIPKLWRWRKDDWRPRLTWLGVAVLVWWGYLIADRIAW